MSDSNYLENLFNLIVKSEQEISYQVDYLRKNLSRFFNLFGDRDQCLVCGNKDYYSGHLLNKELFGHRFVQKLYLSIEMTGEEVTVSDGGYSKVTYFLKSKNGRLLVYVYIGNVPYERDINDLEPFLLRSMVENEVILKFLKQYTDTVSKRKTEYSRLVKITEKLNELL